MAIQDTKKARKASTKAKMYHENPNLERTASDGTIRRYGTEHPETAKKKAGK